jgi:hypothetical protein
MGVQGALPHRHQLKAGCSMAPHLRATARVAPTRPRRGSPRSYHSRGGGLSPPWVVLDTCFPQPFSWCLWGAGGFALCRGFGVSPKNPS